jgi:hypothetical protein
MQYRPAGLVCFRIFLRRLAFSPLPRDVPPKRPHARPRFGPGALAATSQPRFTIAALEGARPCA